MAEIAITGASGRLGKELFEDSVWTGTHALTPCSRIENAAAGVLGHDRLADPNVLSRFDVLLHLAWGSVPSTATPEQSALDQQLLGRLLESAAKAGEIRGKPVLVIFPSTGAVYGNCERDSGNVETDPVTPIGEYAGGKAEAERLAGRLAKERNLGVATLRVANVYGFPGTDGPPQGVIPRLIRCALDGAVFERWGADAEKDYLHIDDLSSALLAVIERGLTGVFNVASGRSPKLSEVIGIVNQLTGEALEVRQKEGALIWDVTKNRIDPSRFVEAAGWSPNVSLEDGIRRLIGEMRASG